jgi:hypothetical protein
MVLPDDRRAGRMNEDDLLKNPVAVKSGLSRFRIANKKFLHILKAPVGKRL